MTELEQQEVMIINENNIKHLIYETRGQKVMLDFDLARIYGYETKAFNQQVKRNKNKFPEDFMFQLSETETEQFSWSKKSTLNKTGNKRGKNLKYLPYAFTEQGIYMLMTVLKGDLAVQQSKALIRLFKQMKDYIVETNNLVTANEVLRLSRQVNENTNAITRIEDKLNVVMDNFIDPDTYKHFLIYHGQRIEADVAYQTIYSLAKLSLIVIDDYISIKTLELLKVCPSNIQITICSDNVAKNGISESILEDFIKDTGFDISIKPTSNLFHDRYIVIDYKTDNEVIYHSGASSKDAGDKVTTIEEIEKSYLYHPLIDELLGLKKE